MSLIIFDFGQRQGARQEEYPQAPRSSVFRSYIPPLENCIWAGLRLAWNTKALAIWSVGMNNGDVRVCLPLARSVLIAGMLEGELEIVRC